MKYPLNFLQYFVELWSAFMKQLCIWTGLTPTQLWVTFLFFFMMFVYWGLYKIMKSSKKWWAIPAFNKFYVSMFLWWLMYTIGMLKYNELIPTFLIYGSPSHGMPMFYIKFFFISLMFIFITSCGIQSKSVNTDMNNHMVKGVSWSRSFFIFSWIMSILLLLMYLTGIFSSSKLDYPHYMVIYWSWFIILGAVIWTWMYESNTAVLYEIMVIVSLFWFNCMMLFEFYMSTKGFLTWGILFRASHPIWTDLPYQIWFCLTLLITLVKMLEVTMDYNKDAYMDMVSDKYPMKINKQLNGWSKNMNRWAVGLQGLMPLLWGILLCYAIFMIQSYMGVAYSSTPTYVVYGMMMIFILFLGEVMFYFKNPYIASMIIPISLCLVIDMGVYMIYMEGWLNHIGYAYLHWPFSGPKYGVKRFAYYLLWAINSYACTIEFLIPYCEWWGFSKIMKHLYSASNGWKSIYATYWMMMGAIFVGYVWSVT